MIFLTICPKLVLVKWNETFLIRQKLILKFHEKKKKIQALTLRIYFKKCSFIDLELFEIGCLRIVLGYITIGLVFFPL